MPLDDEPQQHERALLWAAAWRRRHQYDAEMEPWERQSPDLMRVTYKDGQQRAIGGRLFDPIAEGRRMGEETPQMRGMRMPFVIYDEVQQWPEED